MNDEHLDSLLASYPCLSTACSVTPMHIRGEPWMVIKNPMNGAHVRLHRDLWFDVCHLDGDRALYDWIAQFAPRYSEQRLLSTVIQLQRQGILTSTQLHQSTESLSAMLFGRCNPLMLRIALFNPTKALDAFCRLSSSVSCKMVFVPVLLILVASLLTIFTHSNSILDYWRSYTQTIQVWHLVLLFPLTKCLHELAHAWVLRHLGAEVPEAGVSFIVLFPMPYVDASDAWTLPRRQRMAVTVAGIVMDLLLACLGILLWAHLSPGNTASMAFSVALMGTISVFVFNANPLLKFDGYYLLEDALDSPGLARRSHAFLRYLCKRYLLLLKNSTPPVIARGERIWLFVYAVASVVYRFILAALICFYLVTTLHELGVLLSLFSLVPLFVLPLFRFAWYMFFSAELENTRFRSISVLSLIILCTAGLTISVPMPSSTRTQGVVWVAEQAQLYASQSGTIHRLMVANGEHVVKGQVIVALGSDKLELAVERQQTAVRLAQLGVERYRHSDPGKAEAERIALRLAEFEVDNALMQLQKLTMIAPVAGRVAFSGDHVMPGANVAQGDLLAYVVDDKHRVVRAVVAQQAMGKVAADVTNVQVRLAQNMNESLPARIVRQQPSGNHQLPSAALADLGFGGFSVNLSNAEQSMETRERVFHLELEMRGAESSLGSTTMGTRAFVTLEHTPEPLARRWLRLSRQLLLKHLNV